MVQLPEMLDVGLELLLDFLDGDLLPVVLSHENGALGPRAQPAQVLDLLEGNFPVIPCNTKFPMKTWKGKYPFWLQEIRMIRV